MAEAARHAPLRRDLQHGRLAGVIAGLADRLAIEPLPLRIGFVVLVIVSGGVALLLYAAAWAVIPSAGEADKPAIRRVSGGVAHPGWRVAAGAGLLALAALLVFRQLGIWWSDALVWPLILAVGGAAVLWRQTRPAPADHPPPATGLSPKAPPVSGEARRRRSLQDLYRGGFGVALVVGAALLFLATNDAFGGAREAAMASIVAVLALALILAPFLWRLGRNLAAERAERIRSQERAELAAHLHDSVLQTLTLVQKRADDPRQVATLARRQERELRSWLHGGARPNGDSFAAAIEAAAEGVEDDHGVAIEVVTVGDRELDDDLRAVVAAAREALTNAAKFAPEPGPVSVYTEVADGRVDVFVHDRGEGFDPDAVPGDRRGLRESIVGRMERHGGTAEIRSRPGEGTEVALRLGERP